MNDSEMSVSSFLLLEVLRRLEETSVWGPSVRTQIDLPQPNPGAMAQVPIASSSALMASFGGSFGAAWEVPSRGFWELGLSLLVSVKSDRQKGVPLGLKGSFAAHRPFKSGCASSFGIGRTICVFDGSLGNCLPGSGSSLPGEIAIYVVELIS